jgi:hypothetical protein
MQPVVSWWHQSIMLLLLLQVPEAKRPLADAVRMAVYESLQVGWQFWYSCTQMAVQSPLLCKAGGGGGCHDMACDVSACGCTQAGVHVSVVAVPCCADRWACCLQELRFDNERLRLLETSAREAGQRAQHDAGRLQQENICMSARLVGNRHTHSVQHAVHTCSGLNPHVEHAGAQATRTSPLPLIDDTT